MCKRAHYMLLPWRLTWRLYITCSVLMCNFSRSTNRAHRHKPKHLWEKYRSCIPDVLSGRKGKLGNEGDSCSCAITESQEYKNTDGCRMHQSIFMIHVCWIFHPFLKKFVLFCFLFHYNFIDYCQQETKANQVRVQHLLCYYQNDKQCSGNKHIHKNPNCTWIKIKLLHVAMGQHACGEQLCFCSSSSEAVNKLLQMGKRQRGSICSPTRKTHTYTANAASYSSRDHARPLQTLNARPVLLCIVIRKEDNTPLRFNSRGVEWKRRKKKWELI